MRCAGARELLTQFIPDSGTKILALVFFLVAFYGSEKTDLYFLDVYELILSCV